MLGKFTSGLENMFEHVDINTGDHVEVALLTSPHQPLLRLQYPPSYRHLLLNSHHHLQGHRLLPHHQGHPVHPLKVFHFLYRTHLKKGVSESPLGQGGLEHFKSKTKDPKHATS